MNIGLKTFVLGALAHAAIISFPAKSITFSHLVADQKTKIELEQSESRTTL